MRTFFKFLQRRRALDSYLRNISQNPGRFDLLFLREEDSRKIWLQGAFIWEGTPEGFDFWLNLSEEWKKYEG